MIRLILIGCNGSMGRVVAQNAGDSGRFEMAAGVDLNLSGQEMYPVYRNAGQVRERADVIIDFSHPSSLSESLALAERMGIPVVIATTGLSGGQQEEIRARSNKIPVFLSFNMSLGVNLMLRLVKEAAALLYGDFDMEIVEKHHNRKLDAPSGTALMLADAISQALPEKPRYVYDRHARHMKREKAEIGIASLRGGTIVGEHEVLFAGKDELIEIRHTAMSKDIFAVGALRAAEFMIGKPPGLYNMDHLVEKTGRSC